MLAPQRPVLTLLLLLCSTEGFWRIFTKEIAVTNGGHWGDWGPYEFCPWWTYAHGFSLKMHPPQGSGPFQDDTAVNGIKLLCSEGSSPHSTVSKWGTWTPFVHCSRGAMHQFRLRVQRPQPWADDTAVNNVEFNCADGRVLQGQGTHWGRWGEWSPSCSPDAICGVRTRAQEPRGVGDDTAITDMQFFCCK